MMRQIPNDKYTIAWFKLAECVTKGEKEKAFGVYRLLMHSIEDQAYAYQLEGDLLNAFSDERSIEKYAAAAQLYYTNHRYKEAAAVYEDLVMLAPNESRYLTKLIDVYKHHKNKEFSGQKIKKLMNIALQRKQYELIASVFSELVTEFTSDLYIHLFQPLLLEIITYHGTQKELIEVMLFKMLEYLTQSEGLNLFLTQLEHADANWHARACEYLKR